MHRAAAAVQGISDCRASLTVCRASLHLCTSAPLHLCISASLRRACPAVSQICSLIVLPATEAHVGVRVRAGPWEGGRHERPIRARASARAGVPSRQRVADRRRRQPRAGLGAQWPRVCPAAQSQRALRGRARAGLVRCQGGARPGNGVRNFGRAPVPQRTQPPPTAPEAKVCAASAAAIQGTLDHAGLPSSWIVRILKSTCRVHGMGTCQAAHAQRRPPAWHQA